MRALFLAALVLGCEAPEPPIDPPAPAAQAEVAPRADPSALCAGRSEARDGFCIAAGRGAWREEMEVERVGCERGRPGVRGRVRVRYLTVEGTSASLPWVALDTCEVELWYDVLAHVDYDGDGYDEIVIEEREQHPDGSERRVLLWHFDGRAIGGYPRAGRAVDTLREARDFDRDGRADLITWRPHAIVDGSEPRAGPPTLWHSLADGTFSREDDVARRYLREVCGVWPFFSPLELGDARRMAESDTPYERVACERLKGRSVADIHAAMERELARAPCAERLCDAQRAEVVDRLLIHAAAVDVGVTIPE